MLAKVDIKDIRHIESNMQKVYNAGYVLWEKIKENQCQVNCQTACESRCQGCQTRCEKISQCGVCQRSHQCGTCQACQTMCERTAQCGSRQACVGGLNPCRTCEKAEGGTS